VRPGCKTMTHYFSCLGRTGYGFHKKRVGTLYVELVFLHTMGSTGHIVRSGAFGAQNVKALFSMVGWDR
jgi:hypothetical protein